MTKVMKKTADEANKKQKVRSRGYGYPQQP